VTPDTAIAVAARDLAATDEMLEHHSSTCDTDPCTTCLVWSHRAAAAWALLRARIAEADAGPPFTETPHRDDTITVEGGFAAPFTPDPVDGEPLPPPNANTRGIYRPGWAHQVTGLPNG
jgi:hypothetical protein